MPHKPVKPWMAAIIGGALFGVGALCFDERRNHCRQQ